MMKRKDPSCATKRVLQGKNESKLILGCSQFCIGSGNGKPILSKLEKVNIPSCIVYLSKFKLVTFSILFCLLTMTCANSALSNESNNLDLANLVRLLSRLDFNTYSMP